MTVSESREASNKRRHRNERIAAAVLVLAVAAATAVSFWWSSRAAEELQSNRVYVPRPERITPEILLLQELVRIDSSRPEGVAAVAHWLVRYLAGHGIRAEIIESAPGRVNVYARIKGRNAGNGLLLFNHMDVVPAGQGWSHDPFSGDIALNMMWGRGTLDMKGLMLCELLAFVDVAHGHQRPEHDLAFLATADEETGSDFGMKWIIAHRPDVIEGIRYGITEGGITEMMSEKMTYFGIEVGGKQLVELTLAGDDLEKMRAARIALEPYMFPREAERVIPAVRDYFRAVSPARIAFGPLLENIDRTIAEGEFWRLPAPYRDLTQTSLWVAGPEMIDGHPSMRVKMVNLPDASPEERIAWLERIVAPYGLRVAEIKTKEGPVPTSSTNSLLFRILAGEAERRYETRAGLEVLYRSSNDSRFLRPLGIDCYGVCPYPVDLFQSQSIHHADERIRLDAFMDGIGYMKRTIGLWSNADSR